MTKSQDMIMIGKQTLIIIKKNLYKENKLLKEAKSKLVQTVQYNIDRSINNNLSKFHC